MKWPFVLRVHQARTFHRIPARENTMVLREKDARNRSRRALVAIVGSNRIHENRFIVPARADGENDLASHHIRNSISLTMRRARRMICASHQRGATSADGTIFS
ncbi:hypothetical protein [Bradyrhizobium sp. TM233]|uniref:hypothetical protein n=1 Tax=Bradyrhizobium sp. TM233 TaxID=2599801 RepID=UPI0030C6EC83